MQDILSDEEREVERELLAQDGVFADLQTLRQAGVSEHRLVRLLTLAATQDTRQIRGLIRKRIRQLKSLAGQLNTVARHAERLILDPLSDANFVGGLLHPFADWGQILATRKRAPRLTFHLMRGCASRARREAKIMGRLLRIPRFKDNQFGVLVVLFEVAKATDGKNFDQEVARLLTDVFEAAGKTKEFSPASLATLRSRHLATLRRLRSSHP